MKNTLIWIQFYYMTVLVFSIVWEWPILREETVAESSGIFIVFFIFDTLFFAVLLAGVLFAVFQQAAGQDQMVMMQQWVLSSLPNFTKRSPVSHSMWCLTVFFFSAAADNCHLQVKSIYHKSSIRSRPLIHTSLPYKRSNNRG